MGIYDMQEGYQDGCQDCITAPSEVGVDLRPAVLHCPKKKICRKRDFHEKGSNQTDAWRGVHRRVHTFPGIANKARIRYITSRNEMKKYLEGIVLDVGTKLAPVRDKVVVQWSVQECRSVVLGGRGEDQVTTCKWFCYTRSPRGHLARR
jgi:hypothetical protein